MKCAIIKCTDTNFALHGEYPTIEDAKKVLEIARAEGRNPYADV